MKSNKWFKSILLITLFHFAQNTVAQEVEAILNNKTFISNIGYMCIETPEPNPCAGLQSYLILEFTASDVLVTEKDVSGCGFEHIGYQSKHKWSLRNKNNILIENGEEEMKSTLAKDLRLFVKDGVLVGYKKLNSETLTQFDFEESLARD